MMIDIKKKYFLPLFIRLILLLVSVWAVTRLVRDLGDLFGIYPWDTDAGQAFNLSITILAFVAWTGLAVAITIASFLKGHWRFAVAITVVQILFWWTMALPSYAATCFHAVSWVVLITLLVSHLVWLTGASKSLTVYVASGLVLLCVCLNFALLCLVYIYWVDSLVICLTVNGVAEHSFWIVLCVRLLTLKAIYQSSQSQEDGV